VFAEIGDVIIRGGLPYRDGWDVKGPLVYYLMALSQALFGVNQWGVRVVDLALLSVGSWSLGRIVSFLTSPETGRWAGLGFALIYLSGGYWDTAQPDGWVALLLTIAGLLSISARRYDMLRLGGAGALVGLCALIKWFYASCLFVPLLAAFAGRGSGWQDATPRVGAVVGAFIVPVAAGVAWFAGHGALDDFLEAHLGYAAAVNAQQFGIASPSLGARARGVVKFLTKPHVLAALPAMVLGLVALWNSARWVALVLGSWIAIALVCVVLQNRFVDYQWLPIVPPLVALCAVGLHVVLCGSVAGEAIESTEPSTPEARLLAMATVSVLACSVALAPAMAVARWTTLATGFKSLEQYYDQYFAQAASGIKAARYLREHAAPQDQIALWGSNAAIIYLSQRTSATRFGTYDPLVRGEGTRIRATYREEYLRSLERARPMYFVVSTQDQKDTPTPQDLQGFPELLAFVTLNYDAETAFGGGVTIFRWRNATGGSPPPTTGER
jgi:4-amino-4-deoxy-L-arabinose transferase-like glycosyltransferase